MRGIWTVKTLLKRDFFYTLYNFGYYGVLFASFLVSSFFLKNFLDASREEDILVSAFPLNYPLYLTLIIISLYLVIVSAISISREREQGTLEVLFYGPVTPSYFLWSKYLKDLFLGILTLGFTAAYFYMVSVLTNLGFTTGLVRALFMGVFLISCVVSFGIFISSLTGRIRNSIITLIAALGAFLAIQLVYNMLLGMEKESLSPSMLYLRQATAYVFHGINWVSPFAYLSRGLDSMVLENWTLYLNHILYCAIYSLIFVFLSIYIMGKKGVKA
ncbi:MAG: ABC transporter permease [Candidatus Caldatribacteriaceae bacterium]